MKKSFSAVLVMLFLLLTFGKLSAQTITQTGEFSVEKTAVSNYMLDAGGDQERVQQLTVTFPKAFNVVPKVLLSVTKLDVDKNMNTRYTVKLVSTYKTGFSMEIRTWGGSRIYMLGGMWMAVGE